MLASAESSPAGFRAEPRPPKGFQLFSALRMASPDYNIVDYIIQPLRRGEQDALAPSRTSLAETTDNKTEEMASQSRRSLGRLHTSNTVVFWITVRNVEPGSKAAEGLGWGQNHRGSGRRESPSGVQGGTPVWGLRDEVPRS